MRVVFATSEECTSDSYLNLITPDYVHFLRDRDAHEPVWQFHDYEPKALISITSKLICSHVYQEPSDFSKNAIMRVHVVRT